MSIQAAVSGNAYKNNGGTMKKAGSADVSAGQPVTKSRTLMDDAVAISYGSKVALSSGSTGSSGNVGTFKALTSGTFAYNMVADRYIMKKRTHYVNGVASTLLTSCASESAERYRNPSYLESTRTYGSGVSATYDIYSGTLTKGGNYGGSSSFGQDHAARPTNAVPGELTYKTGKAGAIQDDYKPRTAP